MIFKYILLIIFQLLFTVKEENNSLIVGVDGHLVHYFLPIDMEDASNYTILIPRKEFTDYKDIHNQVWSNKIHDFNPVIMKDKILEDLEKKIKLANKEYNKKNYALTLVILNDAEIIDPFNFQIKKMKGSIYYKLGDYPAALKYWNESLVINPLQPEIDRFIYKATKKAKNKQKKRVKKKI